YKVTDENANYIPQGVEWVQEAVAEFDPDASRVVTAGGRNLDYDFLFVATGLVLDYAGIEGMDVALIGQKGIASVYAGPEAALASAKAIDAYIAHGGIGLFGRPETEMKCAGAPLKMTFITDDKARLNGRREGMELIYNAHNNGVFSVMPVNQKVTSLFGQRDVKVNYNHVLKGLDPGRKVARFATPDGETSLDYDFIHVV
ncbi:MAG TPA: pyridine nucleotide-disulfide oxidoreductase, partial [Pusillimonas sp.]|nr:pyridine nucleotide-disulfide oxidoreductase [Pusillimonas sp.]